MKPSPTRQLARTRLRKLAALARRPTLWTHARRGLMPGLEHLEVPFPPDPATVIDVGASDGQFATMARYRWPNARIVCFEPLPRAATGLRQLADPQLEVHQAAVAATAAEVSLHVAASDDSSSLLPIGDAQAVLFPGTHEVSQMSVTAVRLDDAIDFESLETPILLKIDVQGGELDVLKGGAEILARTGAVYAECSFVELYNHQPLAGEVIAHLHGSGFSLRGAFNVIRNADSTWIQGDMLFVRDR